VHPQGNKGQPQRPAHAATRAKEILKVGQQLAGHDSRHSDDQEQHPDLEHPAQVAALEQGNHVRLVVAACGTRHGIDPVAQFPLHLVARTFKYAGFRAGVGLQKDDLAGRRAAFHVVKVLDPAADAADRAGAKGSDVGDPFRVAHQYFPRSS